jgi:hypothetical protein
MLEQYVHSLQQIHSDARSYDWYVSSFCEDPDLLSQWISYGHQGGYAVGIDREGLEAKINVSETLWILRKITYDSAEQYSLLEGRFQGWIPGMLGADEQKKTELLTRITARVIGDLICYKNRAFEREKEWRLWTLGGDPAFRAHRTLGVVPYVQFDLGEGEQSLIREVWIGPTTLGLEANRAVESLLKSKKLSNQVAVSRSVIPLRWL